MISIQRLFVFLLCVNALGLLVLYSISPGTNLKPNQEFYVKGTPEKEETESATQDVGSLIEKAQNRLDEITKLIQQAKIDLKRLKGVKIRSRKPARRIEYQTSPPNKFAPLVDVNTTANFTRETNPFFLLGAYPEPKIRVPYAESGEEFEKERYNRVTYGLKNDDSYCEKADYYNLAHPENIFKKNMFFTDYGGLTVPRFLIPKVGHNLMKYFTKHGPYSKQKTREHDFDTRINSFFVTMDGFHTYHKIGSHFLCATQMFNHIPGQRALIRKDDLVNSVDLHAAAYSDRSHCFNKHMFFPYAYRLYRKDECNAFFDEINSQKYIVSLEKEPIQYIVKIGHGSHSGIGVFILDSNQTEYLNEKFDHGKLCIDNKNESLIAQKYITNPLLLDLGNKFDFRVYMLIASTNPLIVYYHDGFLRASLSVYDKYSHERNKHLTNTHLAEDLFNQAKKEKVNGMTEKELREYHIWSFEELEEYLIEDGKVTDKNWLNNHLRPQFRKAMVHIVKMSSEWFWKESNIYGLFGLDFMLDENFNLWFIEGNPNPQLIGTSKFLGQLLDKLLRSLYDIEFGLYRSRMRRALLLIRRFGKAQQAGPISEEAMAVWRQDYKAATLNRFEEEYMPNKANSFTLVMNEYLNGVEAYNGHLTKDCLPAKKG